MYYKTMVEPRLKAMQHLKTVLEHDFSTYIFNPKKLPFYTEIKAEYLIVSEYCDVVFLFTDAEKEDEYYPKSLFIKDTRDYSIHQTPLTLLQKEMINNITGDNQIIYCKSCFYNNDKSGQMNNKDPFLNEKNIESLKARIADAKAGNHMSEHELIEVD